MVTIPQTIHWVRTTDALPPLGKTVLCLQSASPDFMHTARLELDSTNRGRRLVFLIPGGLTWDVENIQAWAAIDPGLFQGSI